MTTENQPHVVYPKDGLDFAILCASYKNAHEMWKQRHTWERPWMIMTLLGRVIDPSAEIVDVNE